MTRLQKEDRDPLARKLLACSALKECRDRLVAAYDFSKGKLMEVVVLLQDKRLGYPLPSFYTKTPAWLTVQPVQHSTSAADLNSVLKVAFSWQSDLTWASLFTLSCKGVGGQGQGEDFRGQVQAYGSGGGHAQAHEVDAHENDGVAGVAELQNILLFMAPVQRSSSFQVSSNSVPSTALSTFAVSPSPATLSFNDLN